MIADGLREFIESNQYDYTDLGCALRLIRTPRTADSERSVRRDSYSATDDAGRVSVGSVAMEAMSLSPLLGSDQDLLGAIVVESTSASRSAIATMSSQCGQG